MIKLMPIFKFKTNRILIVDDEEFCLNSMYVMLQKFNIDFVSRVDFCINGQEALQTIQLAYENGFSYGLVLTDFYMPVMDGI